LCCGKILGINCFIQHIVHMVKPMIWFQFITLVLKLKLWLVKTFGPLTIYPLVDWNSIVFNTYVLWYAYLKASVVVLRVITVLHGL
jgi:hypothetical protein